MQDFGYSIFPSENFMDLGLYQFGRQQCTSSHAFGPAARNHYLFHYIISGNGTLMADDSKGISRTYQLKSGQGFMLFPNQITTYIADQEFPWDYIWIEFDGLRVKEAIENAGFSKDMPIYHSQREDLREKMMNEMIYMVQNRDATPFHLIGHLYLFFDLLTRSSAPVITSKNAKLRDFYIKEAIAFIEQNFQNDISVEDIAAACGLNRSYFGKIFHDVVGKPPQQFLLNYRMIKATELLKLNQFTIGEISNAVGYQNQLHFSRAFKNIYGVSPREWRKNKIHLTK